MSTSGPVRLKKGEKRERLVIYLTTSERNAIVSAANQAGASSLSEWGRQKLIQGLKVNRSFDEIDLPLPNLFGGR